MKLVLTGGCTGGHIYPALAIGDKFREEEPDCEIIYIASGEPLEKDIIPKNGYTLYEVESTYLDRSNPLKLARTALITLKGINQARRIMSEFRPDAVISTGSFVSVPVVMAARQMGIPVYLHEQNGFPGVSNRMASGFARTVFLGFDSAREHFKKKDNLILSGNPVRSEFDGRDSYTDRESLGIPQGDFVIMIFGGSLGSDTTNQIGEAVAREYGGQNGYTVIWGTGKDYYDEIRRRLRDEGFAPENVRISPFIENMPEVISACDIIISRSGALSTAETTMVGRAAIFIPSPNVTADHQYYNAKSVADVGGAVIVREDADTVRKVMRALSNFDNNRDIVKQMARASRRVAPVNATQIIYDTVKGVRTAPEETAKEPPISTGLKAPAEKSEENYGGMPLEPGVGLPADHPEMGELGERISRRKLESERKRKRFRTRFYVLTSSLIILIVGFLFSISGVFTVDSIEVEGNSRYTAEEIINMAHAVPGRNIIYESGSKDMTEYLENNPYIKKASVRRKLPSTLVIRVTERQEMVAFKYDDEYLVMDETGVLLRKSRNEPKTTIAEGIVVNRIKLGQKIGAEDEDRLGKTLDLVSAMSKADLYFVRIDMTSVRRIRAYIYDSLLVRTDYETLIENLENGRLHSVMEELMKQGIRRGTITFDDDGNASFMPVI